MAKNIELMGAVFPDVPSIKLPQYGGGLVSFDDTSDADAVAGDIAQGKTAYVNGVKVVGTNQGGGGGIGTLLATKVLGTLSTTSTSAVDIGQELTIPNAVDYDLIITEISVDTPSNNRHLATVSMLYMTASSDIATKNGVSDTSRFLCFKLASNGVAQSRYYSSGYGVYARVSSTSITDGTINLKITMKYNSTYTGTIDGDYTARAYGVNLYDLIGG